MLACWKSLFGGKRLMLLVVGRLEHCWLLGMGQSRAGE